MVTIYLNGEKREIEQPVSVDRLLDLFSLPKQRVAIELNRLVIRKEDWEKVAVNSDDRIEVVHFVGGG
ncbi:MAG: sulfur carrier protein ThiS [Pyrinomonadaceae bacterium]|nr:sulfur carrier protein ThiS [Pyrinomonadaceae bacterium]